MEGEARDEGASAELSDMQRRGDEALRRVSPRRRRERRRRERERGRDPEHRAELPRVPSAALFRAEAGRNLSGRGGFDRTAARRRICIRQAAAWTEKPPAQKGEHGCPKQSRTWKGKPAQHKTGSNKVSGGKANSDAADLPRERAPRRCAPTNAARRLCRGFDLRKSGIPLARLLYSHSAGERRKPGADERGESPARTNIYLRSPPGRSTIAAESRKRGQLSGLKSVLTPRAWRKAAT